MMALSVASEDRNQRAEQLSNELQEYRGSPDQTIEALERAARVQRHA